jgi:hypothetical protein
MRSQLDEECEQHPERFECPDALVNYDEVFGEYGLIIHGSPAVSHIGFCPWCGTRFPESKRDRWYAELEALGFEDPNDDPNIPERYLTGEWYGA